MWVSWGAGAWKGKIGPQRAHSRLAEGTDETRGQMKPFASAGGAGTNDFDRVTG